MAGRRSRRSHRGRYPSDREAAAWNLDRGSHARGVRVLVRRLGIGEHYEGRVRAVKRAYSWFQQGRRVSFAPGLRVRMLQDDWKAELARQRHGLRVLSMRVHTCRSCRRRGRVRGIHRGGRRHRYQRRAGCGPTAHRRPTAAQRASHQLPLRRAGPQPGRFDRPAQRRSCGLDRAGRPVRPNPSESSSRVRRDPGHRGLRVRPARPGAARTRVLRSEPTRCACTGRS